MMPKNLTLIRHGESEQNVGNRMAKKGEEYPEGFFNIRDREFRLSSLGVEQALLTGKFLKEKNKKFDVIFVSDHVRAKETAGLILSIFSPDSEVIVDPLLGERSWGNFDSLTKEEKDSFFKNKKKDPLHVAPSVGSETMLYTRLRTRILLDRISRQYSDKKVLVISHGEYIESIWAEICRMDTETQKTFFNSSDGDIKNCQIVQFLSESGKFEKYISSNVYFKENLEEQENDLVKKKYKSTDLLDYVKKYPKIGL